MGAAAEHLDHAQGVVAVLGLAQIVFAHAHHRIRGEDEAALDLAAEHEGLFAGQVEGAPLALALGEKLA